MPYAGGDRDAFTCRKIRKLQFGFVSGAGKSRNAGSNDRHHGARLTTHRLPKHTEIRRRALARLSAGLTLHDKEVVIGGSCQTLRNGRRGQEIVAAQPAPKRRPERSTIRSGGSTRRCGGRAHRHVGTDPRVEPEGRRGAGFNFQAAQHGRGDAGSQVGPHRQGLERPARQL